MGRGLGSLLSVSATEATQETTAVAVKKPEVKIEAPPMSLEGKTWNIGVEKLIPSPYQARKVFKKEELEELSNSIKQNGILQPIVGRKLNNGAIEIIAGERRWRAAQMAGLHEVPVLIKTVSNKEALELGIIENLQRADLNPIEEAEAYERLINEFNLTQQQAAEKIGKDRASVANALRLLGLSPVVRDFVVSGELSAGHAKVLLSLEDKRLQEKLAQQSVREQMSVRALEKVVAREKAPVAKTPESSLEIAKAKHLSDLEEGLQKSLGTKVNLKYNSGKGSVEIHFYSDDELTNLIEKLKSNV